MVRPSGTVTFLFTDIEGSTRLWDEHPDVMRLALARHDEILRAVIDAHRGFVFSTGGDGVAAAFGRAGDAIATAIEAQRQLGGEPWPAPVRLRVRMGVHTGEAQERDGDYFGPPLNRAARVMAVGHGGQILVSGLTAGLVAGVDFWDLGEHRLRDLSGATRLFQVRAEGLPAQFPPLRTVDEVPGNLPVQVTSFVGRDAEVAELVALVGAHRLVTLTGVGGVGKTRLAVQVAAELIPEFPDGVWLVELASVGDPAAVPDAVATALRVMPQAGRSVTESIAEALVGRRLLVVLDNCEHMLDAAADLVESILTRTARVKVIATSREGLRVGAEHLWAVPSLDIRGGATSAAVELFVERAQAVVAGFSLEGGADTTAVTEICRRLDGIALAIELAAARMVSMSALDVRDRLGDRFRLLSGSRRGLERHQTLRHAVQWSYDLLDDDERTVLGCCSVFADGFDLVAATHVCGGDGLDEYTVLDLLDSLVRKSLVTAGRAGGHARYGLLETIRQFAEDQLAATATIGKVRDRHAGYFADQAIAYWDIWGGPRQRVALDWVDVEFANLRAGFRWATDEGDLVTATAIAAHTTMLAWVLQRFEPVGWAEEILEAATAADLRHLPRLYTAASCCVFNGRAEIGVRYAHTAVALEADPRYDPFETGWSSFREAFAHTFAGRIDRSLEVYTALTTQPGLAHVIGLAGMLLILSGGRGEEARAIAEETLASARAYGSPFWIAFALSGYGRAFSQTDPARARTALRQGLVYAREHRLPLWETFIARVAAGFEAVHGEIGQSLALFDNAIDSFHRCGAHAILAATLADLAVFFDRIEQPEIAATVYGTSTHHTIRSLLVELPGVLAHLRTVLGDTLFDECVAAGAAMELGDAVGYARHHIQLARRELGDVS